jgi:type I site-specific restriction endonuclease
MYDLNFPNYHFKFEKRDGKIYIFDALRRQYIHLTPEEWVRQHTLQYLIQDKQYPKSLIAVEKQLVINQTKRRFDIVVFDRQMQPYLLVECKAPYINIDQKTFDQANQYNWLLKAPYLFLTNGLKHYICQINFEENTYQLLKELPQYNQ